MKEIHIMKCPHHGRYMVTGVGSQGTIFLDDRAIYANRSDADNRAIELKTRYPAHHYFVAEIIAEAKEIPARYGMVPANEM